MKVVLSTGAILAVGLGWSIGAGVQPDQLARFTFESEHMGTTFRIVAYGADRDAVSVASEAAFAKVAYLDSLFSDYRADSEIARLSSAAAGVWEPVAPDTRSILERAREWSSRTDGAFDVTVGPVSRLWRWSARRGALPQPERLARAQSSVGWRGLDVAGDENSVRFLRSDMALDLGGIAKGYAADVALGVMDEYGFGVAFVDAGGDIAAGHAPPGQAGWKIAMPNGEAAVLAEAAIATSGDAERHLDIAGVRYSHIVDPASGLGVVDAPTVTVIARDATTADALASSLSVMTPDKGRALMRDLEDVWAWVEGRDTWTEGAAPGTLLLSEPDGLVRTHSTEVPDGS